MFILKGMCLQIVFHKKDNFAFKLENIYILLTNQSQIQPVGNSYRK